MPGYAEAKAQVLALVEHCAKHACVLTRDVTTNPLTGKWCALVYCNKCKAEGTVAVTMEFQIPVPVEYVAIDFTVSENGVQTRVE